MVFFLGSSDINQFVQDFKACMQKIPVPFSKPDAAILKEALLSGKTIVFPTETFYAFGGNALSETVHLATYRGKQRDPNKPLLVLINETWLPRLAAPLSPKVEELLEDCWPGALTVILPAHPDLPEFMTGPHRSIALRMPDHELVQQLITLGGCPLIGTSANLSGQPPISTADAVEKQLGDTIDLLIDGGTTPGGLPSTLLNTMQSPFIIERPGVFPENRLERYLS